MNITQMNVDGEEVDVDPVDGKSQISVFFDSETNPYTRVNIVIVDGNIHIEQFQVDDLKDRQDEIIYNKQVHIGTTIVKVMA